MNKTLGIVIENYVSGGSDVMASLLARQLSGWDVVIFMNRGNDDRNLTKDIDLRRIRLVRYGWKTLAELGEIPVRLRRRGHNILAVIVRCFNLGIRYPHIFLSALYLSQLFRRYRIDFVLSNNGGYPGGEMCRAAVFAARLRRINALMVIHNMPTRPPTILRPMEVIMDRLVGRCATLVAVSNAVSEAAGQIRSLGKPVSVIENAVEPPSLQPSERLHVGVTDILCIGAISAWKDQIKALEVYRRFVRTLTAHHPDLVVPKLSLIGPTADSDYYQRLVDAIATNQTDGERVSIAGYTDVRPYLARPGQLLLITSNVEGLPLVLLEAMSYGVPAVSTNVGGIGAVITNGVNGKISPIDDLEGLAHSLFQYVTESKTYVEASKRCIEIFNARYSSAGLIEKYQSLIASLSCKPRTMRAAA